MNVEISRDLDLVVFDLACSLIISHRLQIHSSYIGTKAIEGTPCHDGACILSAKAFKKLLSLLLLMLQLFPYSLFNFYIVSTNLWSDRYYFPFSSNFFVFSIFTFLRITIAVSLLNMFICPYLF